MHWQVILGVWEGTKMFPYKLRVTAALLYAISAFERFHRNALALLLDEGESCVIAEGWVSAVRGCSDAAAFLVMVPSRPCWGKRCTCSFSHINQVTSGRHTKTGHVYNRPAFLTQICLIIQYMVKIRKYVQCVCRKSNNMKVLPVSIPLKLPMGPAPVTWGLTTALNFSVNQSLSSLYSLHTYVCFLKCVSLTFVCTWST